MNFSDSVQYLYSLGNETRTIKLGLEQMGEVCAALGNPQQTLRFIHIAGTNGKGSVCAMVEAGLRGAGQKTGLYTSPHLTSPVERIRINGQPVSEKTFAQAFNRVHEAVRFLPHHPTYFETVTAMALVIFSDEKVDTVVWEVGLGGRLDATNVVIPELTIITPVSIDHQAYLGNSLQEIAAEKAGILKPGVPLVVSIQNPEAMEVIEARAHELNVPIAYASDASLRFAPPLPGKHQIDNCKTAVLALEKLNVDPSGVQTARWPGRLELIATKPDTYLDGAHNAAGAAAIAEFIRETANGRKVWLVFSMMRDKNLEAVTAQLFPLADELILTAPAIERAMDPKDIPAPAHAHLTRNVSEALELLKQAAPEDLVFITGSLFLVGEARAILQP